MLSCLTPHTIHFYTDTSDHQLGAIIIQDKTTIDFDLQKINTGQKRYTVTEINRQFLSAI
jgi:hypothetical protein